MLILHPLQNSYGLQNKPKTICDNKPSFESAGGTTKQNLEPLTGTSELSGEVGTIVLYQAYYLAP
jgi:hypothetical protein